MKIKKQSGGFLLGLLPMLGKMMAGGGGIVKKKKQMRGGNVFKLMNNVARNLDVKKTEKSVKEERKNFFNLKKFLKIYIYIYIKHMIKFFLQPRQFCT